MRVRRLRSGLRAKHPRAIHIRERRVFGDSAYKRSTNARRLNMIVRARATGAPNA